MVHAGREAADSGQLGAVTPSARSSDMFVPAEEDPRSEGGFDNERDTLTAYLGDYRLTIELKCEGLDAEGMARRSVEPSSLSLLGLVRHLADVELAWFRRTLAGQDVPWRFLTDDDRDAAFTGPLPILRRWQHGRPGGRRCNSLSSSLRERPIWRSPACTGPV
jgi:hypothetical protein